MLGACRTITAILIERMLTPNGDEIAVVGQVRGTVVRMFDDEGR